MSRDIIRLAGLTQLDQLELVELFPTGSVKFEEEALSGARHGEPITFILVASITSATLGVLASWLMKDRTSDEIHRTVEITDKRGTRKEELRVKLRTSKSPRKEILRELGRICHIDLKALAEKAGG